MPKLPWSEIRDSLTAAIRHALPLQVRKAAGARIAGVGLHMDAYYGSAGLYTLPEPAALALDPEAADNIGDWPISTDWDGREDHAQAFAAHWGPWDRWFNDHLDNFDDAASDEKFRGLLRVACEAMRATELSGLLNSFPKTEGFKVIIAEHDEPNQLSLDRYALFLRTGAIHCDGDSVESAAVSCRITSSLQHDAQRLGELAMSFRGARSDVERRAIANEYSQTVERLIQSGCWQEVPSFEDQLPDNWMPQTFYDYWAEQAG